MNYSIITCTGDRKDTLDICRQYVEGQTLQPKEWVVVDDGSVESAINYPQYTKYVRRNPKKSDLPHTLPLNFLEALKNVSTDYVMIFEDDDWYSGEYCQKMTGMFQKWDLIGHDPSIYYNVRFKKYVILPYKTNISLYCTGFSSKIISNIIGCINTSPFIDREIWRLGVSKGFSTCKDYLTVGLKGLSGRVGKTSGHKEGIYKNSIVDSDYKQLKSWIGNDFELYRNLI